MVPSSPGAARVSRPRSSTESANGREEPADVGQEESVATLPQSSFSRSIKQLKDHEKIFRPSTAPISEEPTVEEKLQTLDAKLDQLSLQVNECLAGIRVIYLGHRGKVHKQRNDHLLGEKVSLPPSPPVKVEAALQSAKAAGDLPCGSARSSINSDASVQSRMSRIEQAFGNIGNPRADGGSSFSLGGPWRNDGTGSTSMLRNFMGGSSNGNGNGQTAQDKNGEDSVRLSFGSKKARSSSHDELERSPSLDGFRQSNVSSASKSSWIAKRQRHQGSAALQVWNFLDNPDSGLAAHLYDRAMPLIILNSVALSLAHALFPAFLAGLRMVVAEMSIESFFCIEIVTRFFVCPNRWVFLFSIYNMIDVLSAFPLILRVWQYVEAGLSLDNRSVMYLVLIGFVPALRLLKTWRRFQQIHLLTKAFKLAFESLPVMLFIYFVVWLFFTAAVFVTEDSLETLGQAMWLTFCSMTSSMFGDVYPRSIGGKIIIALLVLISTLYMAIPIGIIGTCFSEVWADRDRILLVERMRRVFKQNGFTATDIPDLFAHFDIDKSGLLNLEEFTNMATNLKLGLSEERQIGLFQMLDDDGSGGIDDREFCRAVFPEAYPLLYGDNADDKEREGALRSMGRRFSQQFGSFFLPSPTSEGLGDEGQPREAKPPSFQSETREAKPPSIQAEI